MTTFNKQDVYNKHIAPIVEELMQKCAAFDIPAFFSCATEGDENHTHYESHIIPAVCKNYELHDDWITKFVNVTIGFETRLPAEALLADEEAIENDESELIFNPNKKRGKKRKKDSVAEEDEVEY